MRAGTGGYTSLCTASVEHDVMEGGTATAFDTKILLDPFGTKELLDPFGAKILLDLEMRRAAFLFCGKEFRAG